MRPILYGQWLAWQLTVDHSNGFAKGVEPIEKIASNCILNIEVVIKNRNEVLEEVKNNRTGLIFWTDEYKLDQGNVAAAVY